MKTADKTRETPAFPKTFIMAMIFGVGLNPVNSTLISTALAPISHDLRIDAGRATLLISALYLTCAIAQPTAGKLSEIIGPRSVFMAGAALVMIGRTTGWFRPESRRAADVACAYWCGHILWLSCCHAAGSQTG